MFETRKNLKRIFLVRSSLTLHKYSTVNKDDLCIFLTEDVSSLFSKELVVFRDTYLVFLVLEGFSVE